MDDFELTILTFNEMKRALFKYISKLEKNPFVTDLALLRGADEKGTFWTSSSFLGFSDLIGILGKNTEKDHERSSVRDVGILPVLVPSSTLWNQLLKQKIEILSGLYQVSFLEYPQDVVGEQEQVLLKEKLASNKLFTTGKVYTFDAITSEIKNLNIPFCEQAYKEYSYNNQKYIYVDTNHYYNSAYLSNGHKTIIGENLFVKVEPVVWWMDLKKERLISSKVLLGGIQFQLYDEPYFDDFDNTFMKQYFDTYMKKELIPSVIKEKSEVFDSSETLKRLIYKNYGKKR